VLDQVDTEVVDDVWPELKDRCRAGERVTMVNLVEQE
jgi:hypothetical protein